MQGEHVTIESAQGEHGRAAWLYPGPTTDHALCVLLDGEPYRENLDAPAILTELRERGDIPPVTLLVLSHGSLAARHVDYVGNPAFARFVAEDVVDWARRRVPGLTTGGHLIGGVSLSGLAAAHAAVLYPSRFAAALCQSGSFWLDPDTFARLVERHPPTGSRFWLSVGDEETQVGVTHAPPGCFYQSISQIDGVERARAALDAHGADVNCHLYRGGHAFEPWRAELADAVRWLLRPVRVRVRELER